MLPRLGKLDREFGEAINNFVRNRARGTELLREIKSHMIHEGRNSAIRRTADDLEYTKIQESMVETTISFDEIDSIDLDFILMKINEIASQFEQRLSTHLFQTIDEATEKTGLRVDARGKPPTNELFIEALSGMHLNFEKSERGDVTIVVPPQMAPIIERLERERQENPEIRRRWDSMIEEKRNEFREREINRNLVG